MVFNVKKRIVFCLQTMTLGGVEKELTTVLKRIHHQYDITLLLLYLEDAEMLNDIPCDVKIRIIGVDKGYYCGTTAEMIRRRLKKGEFLQAADLSVRRCLKLGMSHSNVSLTNVRSLDESFDLAICYHIHSPLMMKYVVEKIHARKKIGWIHNDFYGSDYPIQRLKKYVTLYNEFVAVSKKVEKEFRELCPWYSGEISTAYNYLDVEEILGLAQESIVEDVFLQESGVKLLTVGRFTEQKGIDLAIQAAAMLKKEKRKFHWFVIGYGKLESTYRRLIADYGVADCFTILGRKTNPYPYIKNCDIYVQPSRHEAFGLVVLEAKILHKPIVCTDFDGADEQINNGVNGIIVPTNDVNVLAEELSKLIGSSQLRSDLSQALEKWHPEDDLREIVKHFV